jgi:hypothetical protein
MPEVLRLTLKREYFAQIANKQKHTEFREQKPYWRKRLEGRKFDVILFRNGYTKDAPEMLIEFRGLRRYGKGGSAYYAIRLGRILKVRRWPIASGPSTAARTVKRNQRGAMSRI